MIVFISDGLFPCKLLYSPPCANRPLENLLCLNEDVDESRGCQEQILERGEG